MGYLFTQCFAYVAQGTAKKIFGGLPSENPAWPTVSLRFPLANVVSLKFLLLCIEFSLVKKKRKKHRYLLITCLLWSSVLRA